MKTEQIADVFCVSRSWARRVKQRRRETGETTPRRMGSALGDVKCLKAMPRSTWCMDEHALKKASRVLLAAFVYAYHGSFLWRGTRLDGPFIGKQLDDEIEKEGAGWGPLQAGLFEGSLERLQRTKTNFDNLTLQVREQMAFGM